VRRLSRRAVAVSVLMTTACWRVGAGHLSPAELESERQDRMEQAGGGYVSKVVHPFVVVASDRETLTEAEQTLVWARDRLRADFFDAEPGKVITIWVWPDESSYMSGSSAVLGVVPSTPYGMYRPFSHSLIVNAGFGWGTLVHEVVHAFIAADFPSAPTWLNEGMGSLFEQPIDVNGHLHGAINWRLPILQKALREHNAPSFEEMVKGWRWDFDGKRGPLYYATSRYVLYWLQEQGKLRDFYRQYRDHDLPPLPPREEWERFVLALEYRR
jgi:hypothetical protein